MICSKTCVGTGLQLTGDFTTNTLMEPYSSLLCAYMPSLSSKHQIQEYRNQMTSMLHSLASTFTTCACGAKARDCVLNRIAEFVENQTPLTPSPSPPSQFTKEKEKQSGKSRKGDPAESSPAPVDLGPLVGIERGFKTRERIPSSGGMGGVEMVPPSPSAEAGPSRLTADTPQIGRAHV